MAKRRPRLRILFDENLSPKVAQALRVLGFNVSHVGHDGDGAPPRGATDEEVLSFAKQTNQVVATSNHDMIMLAAEAGASVIWIDPRGRQFDLDQLAALCFGRIVEWHDLFEKSDGSVCIRALRTKSEVLELEDAARLARRRLRSLRNRKKARRPKKPLGPLVEDDPGGPT
jgi:predicted nuclease of predicted toxin-antitoxin system